MSITAGDLIAPVGELEPILFGEEDAGALAGRIQNYVNEGIAKAVAAAASDVDAAAKAWAYHRAYRAVYLRMSSEPIKADLADQGGIQYDSKQAERFLTLSGEYLAEFKDLTGVVATKSKPAFPPTGAVSTTVTP